MNHLEENKIEISQRLKQIEVNKEINNLYKQLDQKEEEQLKPSLVVVSNVLKYFNNIFNKMFSIHINDDEEDV